MAQAKFIGDIDMGELYFAPIVVDKSRKSVNIYTNSKSTTWANRLVFQVCEDEDAPLIAKYPLQEPPEDGDVTRRNITVTLNIEQHKVIIDQLFAMDNAVLSVAKQRSREWWKKDLDPTLVAAKYKPIIEQEMDSDTNYRVRLKVIVPHPCPDPNRKYGKETVIYRLREDGDAMLSNHAILTADAELVPEVSAMSVWFLGENQFGVSLRSETILCKPKVVATALQRLKLKRKVREVKEEDEAAPEEGVDVSLCDEGGSAM